VRTNLVVVMRPLDKSWVTRLLYTSEPARFAAGKDDVSDLVARMHFRTVAER